MVAIGPVTSLYLFTEVEKFDFQLPGDVDGWGREAASRFSSDLTHFRRFLVPYIPFSSGAKRRLTTLEAKQLKQFRKDVRQSLLDSMGVRFGGVGFRISNKAFGGTYL